MYVKGLTVVLRGEFPGLPRMPTTDALKAKNNFQGTADEPGKIPACLARMLNSAPNIGSLTA